MQEITHQGNTQKSIEPLMEFDLDSLDFKPVTKGLGFHQDKTIEKKNKSYSKPVQRQRTERAERISRELPSVDLKREVRVAPIKLEEKAPVKKKEKTAKLGVQGTGFVFDLFLISGLQILLNFVFLRLSGLTNIIQFLEFTWIEQSIFFSFLFLFYFTLLDLVASPGKRMFSLRLRSTSDSKVTIDQTLIRSVVTLLSFVTVFMPLLFDFQGKLSDTKVIEDV